MNYDFENVIERYDTGSGKWAEIKRVLNDTPKDIIPFSVADMEIMTAPEIKDGLKKYIDNNILGYAVAPNAYKESVVYWMKTRHEWNISHDWICPAHGVVDAFHIAIKAYTEKNDGIMLMTPVYYPMYGAIEKNNRKLVCNKLIRKENRYAR